MSAPALETARLRLRALEPVDRALFHQLYGDAETMRHIGRAASERENNASFRATLNATRKSRRPRFFTILKKRGAPIGLCSIRSISVRDRSAEVGIMLVRSALRRGYGSEALSALVDVTFGALPIDIVWAQYRPANAGIARLIESLGFSATNGWRPRGARMGRRVRVLQRSAWRKPSDQLGDYSMSNIIGFLENAGRDAAMRHANREQLLKIMERAGIASERSVLDSLLGARETMFASNEKIAPPQKKPVKKTPAKKPAKKAPSKKK